MKQMYFCPLFCLFFCFWYSFEIITNLPFCVCDLFPFLFCIQVTASRARICVRMCVCVSRFALISNPAYTRACCCAYFVDYQLFIDGILCCIFIYCWKSIVYKLFQSWNEIICLFICVLQISVISLQRQVKITATW